MKPSPVHHHRGQSLQEYALVGGLVAAVCIAGVFSLTNSLQGSLNETLTGTPAGGGSGSFGPNSNLTNLQAPSLPSTSANNGQNQPQSYYDQLIAAQPNTTFTLPNGQTLQVPGAANLTLPEALAPNGQTEVYLALLQQMIDQMKEANADPQVIASLEALANKGHNMGDDQKVLDGFRLTAINKAKEAFAQNPNDTMLLNNVMREIGSIRNSSGFTDQASAISARSQETFRNFRASMDAAREDMASRGFSADIQEQVNMLGLGIIHAANASHSNMNAYSQQVQDYILFDNKRAGIEAQYNDPSWTLTIQNNSNQICNQSQGGQCIR